MSERAIHRLERSDFSEKDLADMHAAGEVPDAMREMRCPDCGCCVWTSHTLLGAAELSVCGCGSKLEWADLLR
jgi:hypothetical protein